MKFFILIKQQKLTKLQKRCELFYNYKNSIEGFLVRVAADTKSKNLNPCFCQGDMVIIENNIGITE